MKSHIALFGSFMLLWLFSCFASGRASALEVFVNGAKFTSIKDYRDSKLEDEGNADANSELPGDPVNSDVIRESHPKSEPPQDWDPAKGKTLVISRDGSIIEQQGVIEPSESAILVPDGGKTAGTQPGSADKGPLAGKVAGQSSAIADHPSQVIDRGRIAGVQPPLAQVVEQFRTARGIFSAQQVSSSSELEEGLRKALQSAEGVVLLIAGSGKVRLYDLRSQELDVKAADGQKTR